MTQSRHGRRARPRPPQGGQARPRPEVESAAGPGPEIRTSCETPRPAQPVRRRSAGWTFWAALALVVLTMLVFAPVRHYDFVELDDPLYVRENPHVAAGLTGDGVRWAFSERYAGYWIPIVWLSYMVDVQVAGMNPGAQHVTNLLFHVANTLLLFWLLRRITGATGRSAFVAALFAIHPLHVESVAWITERKDVLSTFFLLLALWGYAAYARRPGIGRYAAVVACFVLGLMAKPMLVTLPFVLLLMDVWPLGRAARPAPVPGGRAWLAAWWPLFREKLPLFLIAAAFSLITFRAQSLGGAVSGLAAYSLTVRVENALVSYVGYLVKMVWPTRLGAFYSLSNSVDARLAAGTAVLLVAVSLVVMRAGRRHPYLPVGWFWYVGTLVPVIGLVQVGLQSMADRFTYVPLIGVFVMVAWGVPALAARWSPGPRVVQGAAVLVVVALAVVARQQLSYWKDSVAMWTRATEITLGLDSYHAHMALAILLDRDGRKAEAIGHLTEAVRLKPDAPEPRYSLGMLLAGEGKTSEAVAALSEAVRLGPTSAPAQHALGRLLDLQGRIDAAIAPLSEAVRLQPDSAEAHTDLGYALLRQGKVDEARAHYREAVRLNPKLPEAHNNLGALLLDEGQFAEAVPELTEAVRLNPDFELAHMNLGLALARTGRRADAIREFNEVLRISPGSDVARRAIDELSRAPQPPQR